MARTGYRVLPIANVRPNPNQPRKHFDETALDELAATIKEHGLLTPIRVRPVDGGEFEIVCGERRYRAHLRLGWATIACIVEETDDQDLADRAIIENLQRKDITPLEEALAFQRRLDQGVSVEELARRLGIKQAHRITERVALLRLAPEYQDALAKQVLAPSQAFEMARLGHAYQRVLWQAIRDGKCPTYQQLRATTMWLQSQEQQGRPAALQAPVEQASMFASMGPTDEERAVLTALDKKIERLVAVLCDGFQDNEAVIVARVSPSRAETVADQLELIEKQLSKLRLSLRAASVGRSAAA
jgi:ParB/RepB/Spo0J family partition protein